MKIDIGQLEFINSTLREIVVWLEKQTGLEFTVTSLYRINDGGVHGALPLRGIDLRCKSAVIGIEIQNLINDYWLYDVDRPEMQCCMYHDAGSGNHLHVQVHPNTVKL